MTTRVAAVVAATVLGLGIVAGCAQVPAGLPTQSSLGTPPPSAAPTPSSRPVSVSDEFQLPPDLEGTTVNAAMRALLDDLGSIVDTENVEMLADIDGGPSGYASLVVKPRPNDIDIYWKGPVPASVTAIIEAHPDVEVIVIPVQWSHNELIEGCNTAWELLTSEEFDGLDLQAVGPTYDASGLHVQIGDATQAEVDGVRAAIESATGMPVYVEAGVDIEPASTG